MNTKEKRAFTILSVVAFVVGLVLGAVFVQAWTVKSDDSASRSAVDPYSVEYLFMEHLRTSGTLPDLLSAESFTVGRRTPNKDGVVLINDSGRERVLEYGKFKMWSYLIPSVGEKVILLKFRFIPDNKVPRPRLIRSVLMVESRSNPEDNQ